MLRLIKLLEAAVIAVAMIFSPIKEMLFTTGLLVVIDLVCGVLAAKKRNEPINSSGLRRTVTKVFVYEAAIMLAFITERYISGILPFVKMAGAMISVVELKSVYENLNELSGSDLLKSLIDKLGSTNKD